MSSSLLEQEIRSQPEVLARLLERERPHVEEIVTSLPPFTHVLIAARGSSDHAALYAKYVWAALAGHTIALATPSLYTLYGRPPRLDGALVVGISQSGQSPDIVAVLEEGRRQGRPTLAITNDAGSPLARAADHVVALHAGAERSVAATKTYTAQLTVLALFAAAWSPESASHLTALEALPSAVDQVLAQSTDIARLAERYRYMDRCVVIGRGFNYATAFELTLKLKELTYVMANAYSSADFRHGPIATVDAGLPAILIMPRDATYGDMRELAEELQRRGAELLVISEEAEALALARTPLPLVSGLPDWLSPVTAILPGQMLALHLALTRGYNPDVPRGLQKVTLTL
ncbi:SIS domain-containing protein [Thermogemmatispora tikiterensis]|uniref:Glucosamine--fructose-6-phosphate aminotransferase n=1 Tax=Thermogemmatispora tikiterensis TaxID=1825093 RepID=A0A328VPR2_9CHLR|nr:SIS domain-containing protein [Thermogemmatispora tikiterensis]RAQ98192.1 glucosamine--fructose-6-phosphate aminotransferase [Thermogemmatispora tikiterensis]